MREVYSLISDANAVFKTIIVALKNRLIKHLEERQIRHISEAFGEQYVLYVSVMF